MSSPKDILLQHFSEAEIDALVEGFFEDEWKESGYNINHVLKAMSVSIMNDAIDMHSFGDAMGRIDPNNDGDQNFSNTTTTRSRRASSRRASSRSRASHRSTSPSRSRQSSGQGGGGGISQGIPATPKNKKKEPADYDEAVGKLSHTASGLKLDDDIMDVDKEGESGVTLSSKEGGNLGTTNTSTTENDRQGSVAMAEDGVDDHDVKMKDTETSRILETPKKQANNNGEEDDTKQAAVVYAVPKIEIKEVYGTDSLTNCLTKCEKCKLSAVIRVEVDGKVFILCNDHLELERLLGGWPYDLSLYKGIYITDDQRAAQLQFGCSNESDFKNGRVNTPPQRISSCPEDDEWYDQFRLSKDVLPKQSKAGIALAADTSGINISSVIGPKSPFTANDLKVESLEDIQVLKDQVEEIGPDILFKGRIKWVEVFDGMTDEHVDKDVVLMLCEGLLAMGAQAPDTIISGISDYLNKNKISTKEFNERKSTLLEQEFMDGVDSIGEVVAALFSGEGYKQSDLYEPKWTDMFNLLKEYAAEDGNSVVVAHDVVYKEKNLGYWVHTQRKVKKLGAMDTRRKNRLDSIGFVWNANKDSWDNQKRATMHYVKENGHYPRTGVKVDNLPIGNWWMNQCQHYKNNEHLTDEQRAELEELPLGGIRDPYGKKDKRWDDSLKEYLNWMKENPGKTPKSSHYGLGPDGKSKRLRNDECNEEQLREKKVGEWARDQKKDQAKWVWRAEEKRTRLVTAGILGFDKLNISLENTEEHGEEDQKEDTEEHGEEDQKEKGKPKAKRARSLV